MSWDHAAHGNAVDGYTADRNVGAVKGHGGSLLIAACRQMGGPLGQALGISGTLFVAWTTLTTAHANHRTEWPQFLVAGVLFLAVTVLCRVLPTPYDDPASVQNKSNPH